MTAKRDAMFKVRSTAGLSFVYSVISGLFALTIFAASPLTSIKTIQARPLAHELVSGGGDTSLLVMLQSVAEGEALAYRIVNPSGAGVNPGAITFAVGQELRSFAAGWNGESWLIAWSDQHSLKVATVGADGALEGTSVLPMEGRPVAVAGSTEGWLVVLDAGISEPLAVFITPSRELLSSLRLSGISTSHVDASAGPLGFLVFGDGGAGILRSQLLGFDRRPGAITVTPTGGSALREVSLVPFDGGFIAVWTDESSTLQAIRLLADGTPAASPFRPFADSRAQSFDAASGGGRVIIVAARDGGIIAASIPEGDGVTLESSIAAGGEQPATAGFAQGVVALWRTAESFEGRSLTPQLSGASISSALSEFGSEHRSFAAAGRDMRMAVWVEETSEGWRVRGIRLLRGAPVDSEPIDFGPARDGNAVVGVAEIDRQFLVMWHAPAGKTLYYRFSAPSPFGIRPLELYPIHDFILTTNGNDYVVFGVTPVTEGTRRLFTQRIPRDPLGTIPSRSTHWQAARPNVLSLDVVRGRDRYLTTWTDASDCPQPCATDPKLWAQYVSLTGSAISNPFLISGAPGASGPVVAGSFGYFFIGWQEGERILGTVLDPALGGFLPSPTVLREALPGENTEDAMWIENDIFLVTSRRIIRLGLDLATKSVRATPSVLDEPKAEITHGGTSPPDVVLLDRRPLGLWGGVARIFAEPLQHELAADLEVIILPAGDRTSSIRYEVIVRNNGPAPATAVRLDLHAEDGMVRVESSTADCVTSVQAIRCLIPSLAPGALWAVPLSGSGSLVSLTSDVAAMQNDLTPANNRLETEIGFEVVRRRLPVGRPTP